MDLDKINSRLTEIKIEKGTVRFYRNISAIITGAFTLCSGLIVYKTVNHPSTSTSILSALVTLNTLLSGIDWYKFQKRKNELDEEQQELKEKGSFEKVKVMLSRN